MMTGGTKDAIKKMSSSTLNSSLISEATEALMVLGYDKNTVLSVLGGINTDVKDVGEIIKAALKKLSR